MNFWMEMVRTVAVFTVIVTIPLAIVGLAVAWAIITAAKAVGGM